MPTELTPEQIDKMDGPALSRFVAVEVMGWKPSPHRIFWQDDEGNAPEWIDDWHPDGDRNQLTEVIAKLSPRQFQAIGPIMRNRLLEAYHGSPMCEVLIADALLLEPTDVLRCIAKAVNECPSK